MSDQSHTSIMTALAEALHSGRYSDFDIVCGGNIHKVHRVIVAGQSEFFAKALNYKEGVESKIELPEDDPAAVRPMIEYFYKGTYTVSTPHDGSELLLHISVFAVASKYMIKDLKTLAASNFQSLPETFWDSEALTDAIRAIYEPGSGLTGSVEMKEPIINACDKHIAFLYQKLQFQNVMTESAAFGLDLVGKMRLQGHQQRRSWTCRECRYENNEI